MVPLENSYLLFNDKHGLHVGWLFIWLCAHRHFDLLKAFDYIDNSSNPTFFRKTYCFASHMRTMFWTTILHKYHGKKGLTLQLPGPRSRFLETILYFIRFSRYFKEIWRTVTILCMNKIYIFWSKKYFLQRAQRTLKISWIQRRTCLLFSTVWEMRNYIVTFLRFMFFKYTSVLTRVEIIHTHTHTNTRTQTT